MASSSSELSLGWTQTCQLKAINTAVSSSSALMLIPISRMAHVSLGLFGKQDRRTSTQSEYLSSGFTALKTPFPAVTNEPMMASFLNPSYENPFPHFPSCGGLSPWPARVTAKLRTSADSLCGGDRVPCFLTPSRAFHRGATQEIPCHQQRDCLCLLHSPKSWTSRTNTGILSRADAMAHVSVFTRSQVALEILRKHQEVQSSFKGLLLCSPCAPAPNKAHHDD